MKLSKKVLAMVLALVMVFCTLPMSSIAEATTAEQFVSNENLCVLAERLLKDLAARSDAMTGTIIQFVLQFVTGSNLQDYVGDTDLYNATDDQLADILVEWIDKEFVTELNSDDMLGKKVVGSTTIADLLKILSVKVGSFKEIYESLISLCGNSIVKGLGDAKNLDATELKNADTSSNISMITCLLKWLGADGQITIVKKLLMGDLKLGSLLLGAVNLDEMVTEDLNETMKNLPETIRGLAYSLLNSDALTEDDYYTEVNEETGETETHRKALEDSYYADYTIDELLAVALIGLLKTGHVEKAEADKAASLTFYELLGEYAVTAIEKYALEPINGQFKNWLKNDVAAYENYSFLETAINWDFEVKAEDFNLDGVATEGIFAKLNEILVGFAKAVFTPETVAKMNLQEGGNDKLQANLEGVVTWFIDVMPDTFEGFDFTAVKAANATATLEEKAVAVLSVFWPTWFGDAYPIPADVKSLERLGAYAVYCAVDKFIVPNTDRYADWPFGNCKDALLIDNADATDEAVFEALLNVGLDVAIYALNKNTKYTSFVMTPDEQVAKKAAGWDWEDFLDEIADWGIGYIAGLPAIADVFAGNCERGTTDGLGAFYKVNVVLNKLLPTSIFTDCGDGYFTADVKTLAIDKFFGSIFDFDFSGAVDMLNVNNNEGNPFNKPLISALLDVISDLLFGIFEYDATTGAEATADYKGKTYTFNKGTNDQFYLITKVEEAAAPVIETTTEAPTTEAPTTEAPTTEAPTTEAPVVETTTEETPAGDVTLGDVNGDGKIRANDARKALRFSADLDIPTAAELAAADLNGDGMVRAGEARKILRVSADLMTPEELAG